MRQIVLDTETTGLDPREGHRIIEIGGIEILNRRRTQRLPFHQLVDPEREIDAGAQAVHGISRESLAGRPKFRDIAAEFLEYIRSAELVIHNAPFDLAFLDAEFSRLDWGRITDYCTVRDTLEVARGLHPGRRNSLDALCKRYNVDNSHRDLHGALLDAELLVEVYLAMTGGQTSLRLELAPEALGGGRRGGPTRSLARDGREPLRIVLATATEASAHAARLAQIEKASGGRCLWLALEGQGQGEAAGTEGAARE
jgi:DNA polymerase-3 subunit epsilon